MDRLPPPLDNGDPFVPRPALAGGHSMTLYGWGNPRYFPNLPPPTRRLFEVDRDTRVLADCHWQPEPWTRATLITLHGLNGSSDAHYMRGLAAKAFARGMNIVRLNQRNCGDTEHLSAGLFHSGLTADPAYVISECVRALERRSNILYQWNFVRDLKRRIRRKDRMWPGRFDVSLLAKVRTV